MAIRVTTFDPDFFVRRPGSGPAAKFDLIESESWHFVPHTNLWLRGAAANRAPEMKSVAGTCCTITALSNLWCAGTSLRQVKTGFFPRDGGAG